MNIFKKIDEFFNPQPKVGEFYILNGKHSPFHSIPYKQILEVKDGWVQYISYPDGFINDCEISSFMKINILFDKENNG